MSGRPASTRALVVASVLLSVPWALALAFGRAREMLFTAPALAAALVVVVVVVLHGGALRQALSFDVRAVLWGLALGVASAAATVLLYPPVADALPFLREEVRAVYADARFSLLLSPLLLLVVVAEELLWRGMLLDALRRRMGTSAAIPLSTLLYALPQLGALTWVTGVLALLFGAAWAVQRRATGSLLSPILAHAVWTFTVVALFPLEPRP